MAFNLPFRKPLEKSTSLKDKTDSDYEFLEAIDLFRSQRKKLGISLEELSNKTKISRNVLIGIENGWEKYLPEKTYLISMLKTLEIELDLESGNLNGLLSKTKINNSLSEFKLRETIANDFFF